MAYYELVGRQWWIRYSELVKTFINPHNNNMMIERIYIEPDHITLSRNFYKFRKTEQYIYDDGTVLFYFEHWEHEKIPSYQDQLCPC